MIQDLQKLLDSLNKVWNCGDFSILNHTDDETGFDLERNDIVIYYDYCSDGLSDGDKDRLVEWLYDDPNGGLTRVKTFLAQHGYQEIADNDGSGGGLYYGATQFRMV